MQPVLHIGLLGDFQLLYNDAPVIVHSARLQSLLAYLSIHHRTPQPRRQIAFLLWPDNTESQAYRNLRRQLHHLRSDLPLIDQVLEIDNVFIRWRSDASFTLDVANFEHLLTEAEAVGDANPVLMHRLLQQAVDSYRGPLLPDCYNEWILPSREKLEDLFAHTLEQLAEILEEQREYAAAIRTAERLLHHDPLSELAYRRLMRLHSLNKDRARALRIYHDCYAILEQELGVEPAPDAHLANMGTGRTGRGMARIRATLVLSGNTDRRGLFGPGFAGPIYRDVRALWRVGESYTIGTFPAMP
jgi:DNA-binding SARP family transcriptional activator